MSEVKRQHYFQVKDEVRILNFIGKEFEDDRLGEVTHRDGEYILVKLYKSGVEVERYSCELEIVAVPLKFNDSQKKDQPF